MLTYADVCWRMLTNENGCHCLRYWSSLVLTLTCPPDLQVWAEKLPFRIVPNVLVEEESEKEEEEEGGGGGGGGGEGIHASRKDLFSRIVSEIPFQQDEITSATGVQVHISSLLTYADACCRMLPYADACCSMLTHAAAC